MASTSHPEFNDQTEGLEVAKAFAENIRGRTIIVTGVNKKGIGYSTAEAFASQEPSHVIITGRNPSKLEECIGALKEQYPKVNYRALQIDLSSQKSVRAAASEVLGWTDVPVIHTLVNSAGVMQIPERTLSEDGIEMHFATNHIGHFLFACLIMPKLIKAAEQSSKGSVRIVNVSSLSPTMSKMRWSDINFDKINKDLPEADQPNYEMHKKWGVVEPENKSYIPIEGYYQSKVANVLFGIAANKRLFAKHGILSVGIHPGVISTELSRSSPDSVKSALADMIKKGALSFRSLGAGSATSMVAALDPKLEAGKTVNGSENYGSYLIDCQISDKAHPLAVSSDEAEKLWKLSEQLVKEQFEW